MEKLPLSSRRSATPADINRNGRPTSIGTGGRNQSECPADIIGIRILLEQHDEWAVQRARYMTLETMAGLSDDPFVKLPAVAA